MKAVIYLGSLLLINYGSTSPYRRKADFRNFASRIGESKDVFIAVNHDRKTGRAEKVCMIDGVSYRDGDAVPTSNQCEFCVCRPPGFACSLLQCAPPRNKACRVLQKSGACCPEYQCDCEKDGKIYRSGQKIIDPKNPCDVCFCQGGDLLCSKIHCFIRKDCEGVSVPGRCCPSYDHCDIKQTSVTRPRPLNVTTLVTHQSFFPTAATSPLSTSPPLSTTEAPELQEEQEKVDTLPEKTKPEAGNLENEAENEIEETPVEPEDSNNPVSSEESPEDEHEKDESGNSHESNEMTSDGSEEPRPEDNVELLISAEEYSESPVVQTEMPLEVSTLVEQGEASASDEKSGEEATISAGVLTTLLPEAETPTVVENESSDTSDKEQGNALEVQTETLLQTATTEPAEKPSEQGFIETVNPNTDAPSSLLVGLPEQTDDEAPEKLENPSDGTADGFTDQQNLIDVTDEPESSGEESIGTGNEVADDNFLKPSEEIYQHAPHDMEHFETENPSSSFTTLSSSGEEDTEADLGHSGHSVVYDSFYDTHGYYPSSSSLPPSLPEEEDASGFSALPQLTADTSFLNLEGSGETLTDSHSAIEGSGSGDLSSSAELELSSIHSQLLMHEEGSGFIYNSFYEIPGHYPTTLQPLEGDGFHVDEPDESDSVNEKETAPSSDPGGEKLEEVSESSSYSNAVETGSSALPSDHSMDGSGDEGSGNSEPVINPSDFNEDIALGALSEFFSDEKPTTDVDYMSDEGLFNLEAVTLPAEDVSVNPEYFTHGAPTPLENVLESIPQADNDIGALEGSGDLLAAHNVEATTIGTVEDAAADDSSSPNLEDEWPGTTLLPENNSNEEEPEARPESSDAQTVDAADLNLEADIAELPLNNGPQAETPDDGVGIEIEIAVDIPDTMEEEAATELALLPTESITESAAGMSENSASQPVTDIPNLPVSGFEVVEVELADDVKDDSLDQTSGTDENQSTGATDIAIVPMDNAAAVEVQDLTEPSNELPTEASNREIVPVTELEGLVTVLPKANPGDNMPVLNDRTVPIYEHVKLDVSKGNKTSITKDGLNSSTSADETLAGQPFQLKANQPLKSEKSSSDLPVMLEELDVLLNSRDDLLQTFDYLQPRDV